MTMRQRIDRLYQRVSDIKQTAMLAYTNQNAIFRQAISDIFKIPTKYMPSEAICVTYSIQKLTEELRQLLKPLRAERIAELKQLLAEGGHE